MRVSDTIIRTCNACGDTSASVDDDAYPLCRDDSACAERWYAADAASV